MFGDQIRNARMLQKQGAAVVLHKDDLYNADAIKNAIKTIFSDQRYILLVFKRKINLVIPKAPKEFPNS